MASLAEALACLPPSKCNTLLTTVLLLDIGDLKLKMHCLDSIRRGRARIDEELVLGLYSTGDDKARLAIACSRATSRMRPRAFRRIFDAAYARSDLPVRQRWELVWNLEHFLSLNPRQGPAYERVIRELTRSPHPDLRIRGIPLLAQFGRINAAILSMFTRELRSRSPRIRLTTLNAFSHMADRLERLAPEIRTFIASEAFRMKVARMRQSDPDEDVRTGAWNLLKRLRRPRSQRSLPRSR